MKDAGYRMQDILHLASCILHLASHKSTKDSSGIKEIRAYFRTFALYYIYVEFPRQVHP